MLYVCYVHLTKANPIRGRQTILSLEKMSHKDYDRKGSIAIKKSLVVILKGLGAEMNWLLVNRQS
jgi:hypothetical protein